MREPSHLTSPVVAVIGHHQLELLSSLGVSLTVPGVGLTPGHPLELTLKIVNTMTISVMLRRLSEATNGFIA